MRMHACRKRSIGSGMEKIPFLEPWLRFCITNDVGDCSWIIRQARSRCSRSPSELENPHPVVECNLSHVPFVETIGQQRCNQVRETTRILDRRRDPRTIEI